MSRRSLDVGRLAALVGRAGIDPRYNLLFAVVDEVVVDPAEGVFCAITLLPNEEPETAFLGMPYSGDGFGFYLPVQVDDVVLVAVPEGDTDAGPVIISRLWNAADKPFAASYAAPLEGAPGQYQPAEAVVLRTKPGTPITIVVSSGAQITLKVEGSGTINLSVDGGTVNLGKETHTALEGVVQGEAFDPFTGQTQTALGNTSSKVFARKS